MFDKFEIVVTGGFAVATLIMWLFFFLFMIYWLYQVLYYSQLFKHVRMIVDSVIILFSQQRNKSYYENLYNAGYIYKWSLDKIIKKYKMWEL